MPSGVFSCVFLLPISVHSYLPKTVHFCFPITSDYYHIFELKLSDEDYEEIHEKITDSGSYIGKQGDDWQERQKEFKKYDTLNYETDWDFVREYFTKEKLEDGTFHFVFLLSKSENKLKYIGSNE